jgi:hypothetical protein
MPASSPLERLSQVASALTSSSDPAFPPNAFRAKLPDGLPVNFTPLNPVSFLLKG